jgi:hypothetical protein
MEKELILQEYFQNILGTSEARHTTINWYVLNLPQLHGNMLDAPFTRNQACN